MNILKGLDRWTEKLWNNEKDFMFLSLYYPFWIVEKEKQNEYLKDVLEDIELFITFIDGDEDYYSLTLNKKWWIRYQSGVNPCIPNTLDIDVKKYSEEELEKILFTEEHLKTLKDFYREMTSYLLSTNELTVILENETGYRINMDTEEKFISSIQKIRKELLEKYHKKLIQQL